MKKTFNLVIIVVLLVSFWGCGDRRESKTRTAFQEAQLKYQQGKYRAARTSFKTFINQCSDTSFTEKAESYLKLIKTILRKRELKKIHHIFTFEEEGVFIQAMAFSDRGDLLVLATDDKEFRFYQTQLGLNPKGFLIDSRKEEKEEEGNNEDYSPEKIIMGPGYRFSIPFQEVDVTALSFSPGGEFLVAGFRNGTVGIWKAPEYKKIKLDRFHSTRVGSITFSPDDRWMITSSSDGLLNIWDMQDFSEVYHRQRVENRIDVVAFCRPNSSGINYLAMAMENYILIASIKTGNEGLEFLTEVVLPNVEGEKIKQLSFSPGGKRLASLHENSLIRIWNLDPKKIKAVFKKHNLLDKHLIWPASKSDWNTWASYWKTGWEFLSYQIQDPGAEIYAMVLAHFGDLLITSQDDRTIIFWDVEKQEKIKIIRRSGVPIDYLLLSPDRRTLVSASNYKRIFLWDINVKWDDVF